MNLADVKLDLRDVFGRPVPKADVDLVEKRAQGGKQYRAEVTAPGYIRDGTLLDFEGRGELVMALDRDCECAIDFREKEPLLLPPETIMKRLSNAAARHLGLTTFGWHFEIVESKADRSYWRCSRAILDELLHSGVWRKDKNRGRGHGYREGWERVGSWRSNTHVVSMQATVYERQRMTVERVFTGFEYVVELDLDMSGFRHITQVLWNWLADDETDSRIMAQMCAYFWALRLPFEMRPREES